ncbi:high-affinity nickel-transport protein-domain-containing protein [Globomyces pollinis-pini]|nr:high-affinity nickel-transport protein-domain-containing protein [Globomyces pollinis-pini]
MDQTKRNIIFLFTTLTIVNIVGWIAAVSVYSSLASSSIGYLALAYTLGLRHALDADHIAAIDNTTRRFMVEGKKPVTVGLFFALGHSTIVVIATIIVAVVSSTVFIDRYSQVSGIIGSSVSSTFLAAIGIINCFVFYSIWNCYRKTKGMDEKDIDWEMILSQGGFFCRLFGERFFKVIDKPWKLYFVGFCFGLGFDTATEIALMSIVVIQVTSGETNWIILFLPLLFTCGMTLIDSLDGVLMLGIYGWSLITPIQKLFFNLFVTALSIIFAFGIAIIQIVKLLVEQKSIEGSFWESLATLGDSFEFVGIFIIGSFMASFLVVYAISKLQQDKNTSIENDTLTVVISENSVKLDNASSTSA